ncbi:dihydrofolate reductase [Peribacillus alkalitolerans]|uniref:dihydrofolate reductase n=1 Tax=Peribacillus alkalitolerans TaxID=1550385 RepID=UPI0013CF56CE|nr:dihydrofolate reductase [Peribacillus alkalitolerans]
MISFILAMDENRVIGKDNQLPWHLPADLKYFKKVTMGHPVVMGRKTYESIGRLLPGRENIILTRDHDYSVEGGIVFHSVEEFMDYAKKDPNEEYFVIGGAEIFNLLMDKVDILYITEIHATFEGDTFFPEIKEDIWTLVSSEKGVTDEKNLYPHTFLVYKK